MRLNQLSLRLLFFPLFLFFYNISLNAQEVESCPCENCPALIEDDLSYKEYQLNIFNVKNNDLANPDQCVSKVGVTFTHTYSGDLQIELVSPGGDVVELIGPLTFSQGPNGQTDNRTFDIAFVRNEVTAMPDENYDAKFSNDQDWAGQGVLEGTYYPFRGALADFDEGRVNGTWTLRVGDFNAERNDTGELLDFYVEFCDSEGLVCDPCLDPEDTPDCIFRVDAGEATVVPDEVFCVPVYAENVAFLESMRFPLSWDASVLNFVRVDSFQIENLEINDFDLTNTASGNLALTYLHDTDTLGLVVADSTAIFNICFQAIGAVGDSSLIDVSFPPTAIDIDQMTLLTETFEGKVIVSVDSTADCVNAIQLCGSEPISIDKTKGPGFEEMEGCSPSGQEFQSKWFRFDVLESGDLEFMVQPKGDAIFTYSLYKTACPAVGNRNPIECELGVPPVEGRIIGLSNNPTSSFGDLGTAETSFSAALGVTAGETYFLLVDNFSANGVGFDLVFAGTAKIGDETLQAVIADPTVLDCNNPTIRLDATSSTQGSRYVPTWTSSDDGIIDFSNEFYQPLISVGGTFTLAIADRVSGCVVKDSVFVNTDRVFPEAVANNGGTIDCNASTLTIDNIGSSTGNEFAIKWTNLDIAIPDLPTTPELLVEVAGNYELEMTNTINGCITKDSVLVLADFVDPQLTSADNAISCLEPLATLLATSTTPDVEYEWTGGNLVTPEVTAEILVNDTGMFVVKVTAPNGCITMDEVFVRDDRLFPDVEAGTPFQLNCDNPTNNLNGTGTSTGTAFEYSWSTPDGHFINNLDTTLLSPAIDAGGLYILEVTNTTNGCISLDSVTIDTSFNNPFIRITGDTILTCAVPELTLNASNSDSGAIFQFDWFGGNGNILVGDDTYHPRITQAGDYILNIRNTENGCFSSQVRTITSDADLPIAEAGPSDILACNNQLAMLDGTQSSLGPLFQYKWTGPGTILSDEGTTAGTQIEGLFTLTVTNRNTGCSAQDSVRIFENFVKPAIIIPPDTVLTCENPNLLLTATAVTEDIEFLWVFPDGDTSHNAAINVLNTGSYFITVTGTNGCVNNGEVKVTADQVLPEISIAEAELLTCEKQSVTIFADNSDQGAEFEYFWTTMEGRFEQDSQAFKINPIVTEGGKYYLEIRNTLTGCISKDSVEVPSSVDNPEINIEGDPEIFTCVNRIVPLAATSNIEGVEFQWKLGLDVLSESATYEAVAPGVYSILVINPANNCSTLSSVEVKADTLAPFADAGPTKELNCSIGNVNLDGSLSDSGDEFSYIWNAPTNEVFPDLNQIEVTQPGLYNLIVVNQINGCRTIDTVRVTEARDNPIADAGRDTIYCNGEEELDFLLGGNLTSIGDNFLYSWTDKNQNILGTAIQQRVSIADTFFLSVINTDNQCQSIDSVIVTEKERPEVTLEETGGIDCITNEITYLANSDIPTSSFKWIGSFETLGNELKVTDALLNEDFVAFAEDTLTGCLGKSVTIRVMEDRIPPLVDAGEDTEVNCADTLRLDGQLLSAGIETLINWRTDDGNIVEGKDGLNPIADAAGRYILRIENTQNFCFTEDTVLVSTDQILPEVNLGSDKVLTCNDPTLRIDPVTISTGPNFYYTWKDNSNKIVATTDTLLVDLSGIYQLTVIDSSNLCTKSDVLEVIDSLNPPFIEIEDPDIITCMNNQVILNTNSNLTEGSFQWTIISDAGNILGSANSPDLLVDAAGTYQLEVTNDFSGCQGVKNITVTDLRDSIEIEAGSNKTLTCFNDTTVLAAGTIFTQSENLTFNWTANLEDFLAVDSSLIFTIDRTGTYYLKVIDTLSFCEAIDSFEVDKNVASINYNIGETLTLDCSIESVTLGDLNEPAEENYNYNWTTEDGNILAGADQALAVVERAGLYQIFIQNTINGCTNIDSQRVVENRMFPNVEVGSASILTCTNEQITIGSENTDTGNSFIYNWNTNDGSILEGANSPFAVINESGIYQLSVLDTTTQCESRDSISIIADKKFPTVTFPNELNIDCMDSLLNIIPTTEPAENRVAVQWKTQDGLLLSDSETFIAQVGMPGIYYLELMDTSNSCVTIDSVEIADNRLLPEVVTLNDRMLGCDEASITIDAQGSAFGENINYKWLDIEGRTLSNNTTLTVDMPGNFILQVKDESNNCVNADTVLISENTNPPVSALFDIASPSCNGVDNGFIDVTNVIGGVAPYRYAIEADEPNLTSIFSDLAPNSYVLTITDELACMWDTTITLSQPELIQAEIMVSNDNLVTGELATFSVTTSVPDEDIIDIIWTPEDIFNCIDCKEITTSLRDNTTVGVTIVDINGCESYTSLEVEVGLASVPNAITPNGDGSNDFFIVPQIERNPDGYPESELIIFNRWGDVLYRATPYDNNWDGLNNKGENLVEGTYYYVLRLNTREGEFMKGDITIIRR